MKRFGAHYKKPQRKENHKCGLSKEYKTGNEGKLVPERYKTAYPITNAS